MKLNEMQYQYQEIMFPGVEALCRVMATTPTIDSKQHMPIYTYTLPSTKLSLASTAGADSTTTSLSESSTEKAFPFLDLPLEIRLKIYEYLLPPRVHKIAPTLTYAFGPIFSLLPTTPSSPYKILNANQHPSFPHPTIHTSILRANAKIYHETIPLLYGSRGVVFDFGTSVEVVKVFLGGKSEVVRGSVRCLKVARELGLDGVESDEKWQDFMDFARGVKGEGLSGLRELDLTFWSEDGMGTCFPLAEPERKREGGQQQGDEEEDAEVSLATYKNWEWTAPLLSANALPNIQLVKIKTWIFREDEGGDSKVAVGATGEGENGKGKKGFDCWLAKRMVSDAGLRGRAAYDGVVLREGRAVLRL